MIYSTKFEEINKQAVDQIKFAKGTNWSTIWEKAKQFPYNGFLDINLSPEVQFCVLLLNDDALALEYFWTNRGLTEPRSLSIWIELAKKSKCIIDAGAYTGFYSLAAASVSKVNIYAYEPVSFIYARLAANVILNKYSNIKFMNYALFSEEKIMNIELNFGPKLFSSGGSLNELENPKRQVIQPCSVKTIDNLHKDDDVDLIKIDVEGVELDLLVGAKVVINKSKPVFLIETRSGTHNNVEKFLQELGYIIEFIESSSGADNYLAWHPKSRLSDHAMKAIQNNHDKN